MLKLRHFPWDQNPKIIENGEKYSFNYSGGELLETDVGQNVILKSNCLNLSSIQEYADKGKKTVLLDLPFSLQEEQDQKDAFSFHCISRDLEENFLDFVICYHAVASHSERNQRIIDMWAAFFTELMLQADDSKNGEIPYDRLDDLINEVGGKGQQPVYSLIVRISEELSALLPKLTNTLRKILFTKRQMLPVNRVNELDAACLRWIVRQPGESLYEKASSNNFKLMGLSRNEQYDLLENRVLKDFLYRCRSRASDYIEFFSKNGIKDFSDSDRIKKVNRYKNICSDLLSHPIFNGITRQNALPTPNYVLQNDHRYKKIWKYYLSLIRYDKLKDDLWKEQKVTFRDITYLLLQTALCSLCEDQYPSEGNQIKEFKLFGNSTLKILGEQIDGVRIESHSVPGPFLFKKNNLQYVLEIVNVNKNNDSVAIYPFLENLLKFGTNRFIVIRKVSESGHAFVIPVFAVHCACMTTTIVPKEIASNCQENLSLLKRAIGVIFSKISPLILISVPAGWKNELNVKETDTYLQTINVNPKNWFDEIERLKSFLIQILKDKL